MSGSSKINLYVITVNYESAQWVENLVRSLEKCGTVKKLVVVDHSEKSFFEPKESLFPIQVIRQSNRGFGAGINRGLRAVDESNAIAFICNPDIEILTPETMIDAAQALRDNPHWACIVPSHVDKASNTIYVCRRFYTWKSLVQARIGFMKRNPAVYRHRHFYMDKDLTKSFDVDWAGGSALFFNLSLFPEPLSFDEGFFLYFEDVDFCLRARMHGYSIRYYPSVVVRHLEQKQSQKNSYYFAIHLKSALRFILKYRGLPLPHELHRGRHDAIEELLAPHGSRPEDRST